MKTLKSLFTLFSVKVLLFCFCFFFTSFIQNRVLQKQNVAQCEFMNFGFYAKPNDQEDCAEYETAKISFL